MKITIELPDLLYRRLKTRAAQEGRGIKDFLTEAVSERLRRGRSAEDMPRPWAEAFGGMKSLHRENLRIDKIIEAEFEDID